MEIYGTDCLFVFYGNKKMLLNEFLSQIDSMWPGFLIDDFDLDSIDSDLAIDKSYRDWFQLCIMKDVSMQNFLDESGLVLNDEGEGPFFLGMKRMETESFEVTLVLPETPSICAFSYNICSLLVLSMQSSGQGFLLEIIGEDIQTII